MYLHQFFTTCALLLSLSVFGQADMKWNNPLQEKQIQGRIQTAAINNYHRLPDALQAQVRGAVWQLGTNSAGLYIEFQTDAAHIAVRYQVRGALNMPHMPTIGVSGVDLYAKDDQGNWNWAFGNYSFKDTVSYQFTSLGVNKNFTYRLYLPLYNTVEWMEIGTPSTSTFTFKTADEQIKPIVVYGTSIAQGACATRPGLAWTNRLGRAIHKPIINLAFSGNGRLEKPLIDHINQVDAAVFVLDCIPNLAITKDRSPAQLDSILNYAVQAIRAKHPKTPIILTEHSSGFNQAVFNLDKNEEFTKSSAIAHQYVQRMQAAGMKDLYLLTNQAIGLDINATVDYAHPNDVGMEKIAAAYEALIHKILKK